MGGILPAPGLPQAARPLGHPPLLEAAPQATIKYKDIGRAGHAVLKALSHALRDHSEAESRWLRWRREHTHGDR